MTRNSTSSDPNYPNRAGHLSAFEHHRTGPVARGILEVAVSARVFLNRTLLAVGVLALLSGTAFAAKNTHGNGGNAPGACAQAELAAPGRELRAWVGG